MSETIDVTPVASEQNEPIEEKPSSTEEKPSKKATEKEEKENDLHGNQAASSTMAHPCTPALAKVRQSRLEFKVHSPSDALMSPCTKTLNEGAKSKSVFSHPQHLLRNKQHKELMRNRPED